jgi:hypothetical protein
VTAANVNGWNTVELTINQTDNTKVDVYINGVAAGVSPVESTEYFSNIILNNYNSGVDSYDVRWSNIQSGDYLPIATPVNPRFAEFTCGGATNINSITPTWDAVQGAVSYNYEATTPSGAVYGPVSVGNVTHINGPFGGEGISTFSVQAVDSHGVTSGWTTPCGANYDVTAPTAPIAQNPNGWTNGATGFSWSAPTDTGSALHYELQYSRTHPSNIAENGTLLSSTNSLSVSLPDGPLFWKVRAVDAAGNVSPWSNLQAATIDITTPVLTPSLTGGILRGTQLISLSISEPYLKASAIRIVKPDFSSVTATPGVSNQVGTGNPLTYAWNTKLVSDGSYKIQYSARDVLGHSTTAYYNVVVDNTAPVINITSSVAGDTLHGTTAIISGTATDNLSGITSITLHLRAVKANGSLDGFLNTVNVPVVNGRWSTTINTTQFSDLGEGYGYGITVIGSDVAGNQNGGGTSIKTVNIDNTVPSTPDLTAPVPINGAILKTGTFLQDWSDATDGAGSGVAYYEYQAANDDSVNASGELQNVIYKTNEPNHQGPLYTSQVESIGTSDGVYYWQVRAIDNVGNPGAWSALGKVTVDTAAPDAPTVTAPALTNVTPVSLAWAGPSDVASYTLQLSKDSTFSNPTTITTKTYTADQTSDSFAGLSDGTYYVRIADKDAAGNPSTYGTATFTLDTTAPTLAIAPRTNTSNQPTVTGTVDDPTAALSVSFNGAAPISITNDAGFFSFTAPAALANGNYTFAIIATDANGNTSTQTAVVSVAVAPAGIASIITPIITSPASAVLGASTTSDANGAADISVKGTTDDKLAAAVNSDANKGTIFGLAWYWWILIIAALALIGWFIATAVRRRDEG